MRTRKVKRSQLRMVMISLEDYVSEDDILRNLDREMDLSFVNEKVSKFYKDSGRGAPPEDPERIFRLLIAMIIEGIRSERQLINNARANLRIRWYAGYEIDEPIIDHSTISKFRKRIGEAGFDEILSLTIQQCIEKGYIDNKDISIDRTDMQANATVLKGREQALIITREIVKVLQTSEKIEQLLQENKAVKLTSDAKEHLANIISEVVSVKPRDKKWVLEQINEYIQGLEREESSRLPSEKQPQEMTDLAKGWSIKQEAQAAIKDSLKIKNDANALDINKEKIEKVLEEVKDSIPISRSDPDARHGHTSVKKGFFGYNVNVVIDHKHDLITACHISRGNEDGQEAFGDTYQQHKDNCMVVPKTLRADSEYDTYAIRKQLEKDNVTAYISLGRKENPNKLWSGEEFKVDAEKQEVICPAGRQMQRRRKRIESGKEVEIFFGANCNSCQDKKLCTNSNNARWLQINFDEYQIRRRVKTFNQGEEFREQIQKRRRIEARFGHSKTYHHLGKAMYRGIKNVSIQAKLIAIGLNMERITRLGMINRERFRGDFEGLPKNRIAYSLN